MWRSHFPDILYSFSVKSFRNPILHTENILSEPVSVAADIYISPPNQFLHQIYFPAPYLSALPYFWFMEEFVQCGVAGRLLPDALMLTCTALHCCSLCTQCTLCTVGKSQNCREEKSQDFSAQLLYAHTAL